MNRFKIQDRDVGEGAPCFVIAEMGLGHDGDIDAALAFVDAVADAGAHAVKFQTHIAEAEGTAAEKFRVKVFKDKTRQDYWRRTAFAEEQWIQLKRRADERGIIFLSSPFSAEAARLLSRIGVPAWKIASGETNNYPMLEEMTKTGLPFLVSTGMSRWDEIDRTVALLREKNVPLVLYQCTNRYPCPPEHLGLNVLGEYMKRYDVPVGLSDHSGKIGPAIAARAMGACSVEVHVVFDRNCSGPDVPASVTVLELKELIDSLRYLDEALGSPVAKDVEASELAELRSLFTKSIVAAGAFGAGTVLRPAHLCFKKPGTGIPAGEADRILGRKLARDVAKDELMRWEDLADE